jgi:hypothetical protein
MLGPTSPPPGSAPAGRSRPPRALRALTLYRGALRPCSRRRTGHAIRPVPISEISWAVRCAAACERPRPGGGPPQPNAGSGSHPRLPGGTGARPAWRAAHPVRPRMSLRRSRRPGRADRPVRRRARGVRSARRPARPRLARAIGHGAARYWRDGLALGRRSGGFDKGRCP